MSPSHTDSVDDRVAALRRRQANVTVRVARQVGGQQQCLFMFAGTVDAHALRTIMQQAHRLTRGAGGRWRIEVIASGLDESLVQDVRAALRATQRPALSAQFAVRPRAELRAAVLLN